MGYCEGKYLPIHNWSQRLYKIIDQRYLVSMPPMSDPNRWIKANRNDFAMHQANHEGIPVIQHGIYRYLKRMVYPDRRSAEHLLPAQQQIYFSLIKRSVPDAA